MDRIQSSLKTARGVGIRVTNRDLGRLETLGRWYTLSAAHLARLEENPRLWSPRYADHRSATDDDTFRRRTSTLSQRLTQLKGIVPVPPRGIGPLVSAEMSQYGTAAWSITRYGATAAGLPWPNIKTGINPLFVPHAWMAADIGLALEAHGYRVLSERELATGIDRNGYHVTQQLLSHYTGPGGAKIGKKPDLAILHPDGEHYIAVEIERDRSRAVRTYEEKLTAYQGNLGIDRVLYVCESRTTALRVIQGIKRVYGDDANATAPDFPVRVTVIEPDAMNYHFMDIDNLNPVLAADLAQYRQGSAVAA